MEGVTLHDFLNHDPRPSLIVDLSSTRHLQHIEPAFFNLAFESRKQLPQCFLGESQESCDLRAWIYSQHSHCDGPNETKWFAWTFQDRWRVVQEVSVFGQNQSQNHVSDPPHSDSARKDLVQKSSSSDLVPESAGSAPPSQRDRFMTTFGLTPGAVAAIEGLSELVDALSNVDWAATNLGHWETWPADILQICHIILLNSEQPFMLFLGPDSLLFYNVAYAVFSGVRHPSIIGQSLVTAWSEVADDMISMLAFLAETKQSFVQGGYELSVNLKGFDEECHLKFLVIPFQGDWTAALNTFVDETTKIVGDRRYDAVSTLSAICADLSDMNLFWENVLQVLSKFDRDLPLGVLYTKDAGNRTFRLQGALGLDYSNTPLPGTLGLGTAIDGFESNFMEAARSFEPLPISEQAGTLPSAFIDASRHRGYGDRCVQAMMCPIRRSIDSKLIAVFITGLHTRKPGAVDNAPFTRDLVRTISDLATRVHTASEAKRLTAEAQAQSDSHETLLKEVATSSQKLQRMFKTIEMVDVGIYEYSSDGKLTFGNEAFFRLSGHPRGSDAPPYAFAERLYKDDKENIMGVWDSVITTGVAQTVDMRFIKPGYTALDAESLGDSITTWLTAAVFPISDPITGVVTSVSGCITDISAVKRSQRDALNKAEALERARKSEERFAQFADLAPCPVYIHSGASADFPLEFANSSWFETLGITPTDDFSTVDWTQAILEEDMPNLMEKWDYAAQNNTPLRCELRLKKPWRGANGESDYTSIIAEASPELDSEGNVRYWIGVATNISHLKYVERIQLQRVQEAEEAKRQQELSIDTTSHELRNPLGAVLHCADAILGSLTDMRQLLDTDDSSMSPKARSDLLEIYTSSVDAANTIISCSNHQKRIVDDVLTWSKLNSHLLEISPSLISIRSFLQDIRNMFEIDAQKVGVKLVVQRHPSIAHTGAADYLVLDPGRTNQVVINLITNALKFTRERSLRKVTVTMGLSRSALSPQDLGVELILAKPDRIRATLNESDWGTGDIVYPFFTVQDTGCGLTDEEMSHLFARFSQGSPRTHTRYGGSGLGLFISRELVELQGGSIGLTSQAGFGSTFGFYIAARVSSSPAIATSTARPLINTTTSSKTVTKMTETSRTTTTTTTTSTTSDSTPTHTTASDAVPLHYSILVVEDNIVNQTVLSKQLRKQGHEVHVANHGEECLAHLQRTKLWIGTPSSSVASDSSPLNLDVILMDVEMPIMDGITCARRIRELQAQGLLSGHVPIIAVSANARTEQIGAAVGAGMDDAIAKPFRVVDLVPKIQRLVGRQMA